jgi:hypothetical protein
MKPFGDSCSVRDSIVHGAKQLYARVADMEEADRNRLGMPEEGLPHPKDPPLAGGGHRRAAPIASLTRFGPVGRQAADRIESRQGPQP